MFENIDSTTPERYWLLWASLKAIILGVVCFFLGLFLSLLITIPWSKHYWAGDGQAVLGGMAVSFIFGIASAIAAASYMLRRTIQRNRAQGSRQGR
jgi:nitrate reductase gamma subunit